MQTADFYGTEMVTHFHLSSLEALLQVVFLSLKPRDQTVQFLGFLFEFRRVSSVDVERTNSLFENDAFLLLQTLLRLLSSLVRLRRIQTTRTVA